MIFHKKLFWILLGVIVLGVVGYFSFSPFQRIIDLKALQNKVSSVNSLYAGKKKSHAVHELLEKKVTHKKQEELEKEVDAYLNEYLAYYDFSDNLMNGEEYTELYDLKELSGENTYYEEKINYLNHSKSYLNTLSKRLKELKEEQDSYSNKKNLEDYQKIVGKLDHKKIQEYQKKLEKSAKEMEKDIEVLTYLKDHRDTWKSEEEKMIFLKRTNFNEFSEIKKSSLGKEITFELVKDETPPVIHAEDKTIYVNGDLTFDQFISCEDDVDGKVECEIEGTFDKSKIGDYPIKIKATDQSGLSSEKTVNVHVIKFVNTKPYAIDVIRNQNVVIVYGQDANGEYTNIVKVFVCSTGKDGATPTGEYYTTKGAYWGGLFGNVWGQYTTRIVGNILFHSVPYYSRNKWDLEWIEYNKLGTQASLGCVRLAVRDVKWIYFNCPSGTRVRIYDGDLPSGVIKPSAIKIDPNNPNRGWDPTDDDPSNPWNS